MREKERIRNEGSTREARKQMEKKNKHTHTLTPQLSGPARRGDYCGQI